MMYQNEKIVSLIEAQLKAEKLPSPQKWFSMYGTVTLSFYGWRTDLNEKIQAISEKVLEEFPQAEFCFDTGFGTFDIMIHNTLSF